MKSFLFALLFLVSANICRAQVPNKFNYQAIARDAQGRGIANTKVSVRINILDGSATAASVYGETRSLTTNQLGLFTIAIGSAGAGSTTGNFNTINWSTGQKFIKVEIDPLGGSSFVSLGSTELLSVPYALYAVNGTPGPQGATGAQGPQGIPGAQGAQGIPGTTPQLGFFARLTSRQPVSGIFGTPTVLTNYTEYFDDGNDFNAATGAYTAPSAGVYHFEFMPSFDTDAGTHPNLPCFVRAYKNGTSVVSQMTSKLDIAYNYGEDMIFPFTVKLAAGDVITMQINLVAPTGTFYASGGNSAAVSKFSGFKVY